MAPMTDMQNALYGIKANTPKGMVLLQWLREKAEGGPEEALAACAAALQDLRIRNDQRLRGIVLEVAQKALVFLRPSDGMRDEIWAISRWVPKE